ncbi:hypothetical protein A3K48_06320 [candidate division WOR-1 bacterium RIFOXYA12_FULL_52_29]|uniref:DUF4352 domain-containing protein n=1 Tax=candidate division WOR-1 bacterium RIFOXYC12_FULL_54_18 TaxID=1802584 RepID=A0A1F4T701_UNCSA|nr:MAG: hypothetical protein A3K44_06320 [candidate division WOR-1 bacterium RIFOXYA2_FULL_51_19]OGC18144.1 MAG: hypothetical protein A3K48_06320 [candidate division WOR-1 bacterium RIFOXYA12_FULL_52_29]OGC26999.1 MAG: hypothetical protein A3K32_06315 [candidate division WOR-1 bacterium RIFOXYB2_FULL_45_9]OGC28561.1 MAG: hypothetical protein A3K49_06320 [candidate division WOR-1 bacterium RIFOXYC12_FULL_54_18]OGC30984.1 MAG: hypothetical protein A2346_06300 [candidate division WOR-1 bacterium R
MKIGKVWGLLLIAIVLVGFQFKADAEKKKIVPAGGRNQLQGFEGRMGQWLANGTSKFKVISFSYPATGPNGEKANKGKKYVEIEVEVVNNQKNNGIYGGTRTLNLVDKDGQIFDRVYSVPIDDWRRRAAPKRLKPGENVKLSYLAIVPEKYFPVRLVFVPGVDVPVYRVRLTDEVNLIASEDQTELQGREGKINEWLFNGTTKFKVYSVSYHDGDPLGHKAPVGRKWVAIEIEIKNAHKKTMAFGGSYKVVTLFDQNGTTYDDFYHAKKDDWSRHEGTTRLLPAAGLKAWYVGTIDKNYLPVKLTFLPEPKATLFEVDLKTE